MAFRQRMIRNFKKGLKEYEKVVTKYENAKPIGSRIIVRQAARKATKVRTQQAISLRLRKKTGPEDLARASKAITKIARERLVTNGKTYAIQYVPFSLSGAKTAGS